MSKIDPELKKKLLKESQAPFKGLRRILWIAFSGSAFLGLLIMLSRIANGNEHIKDGLEIGWYIRRVGKQKVDFVGMGQVKDLIQITDVPLRITISSNPPHEGGCGICIIL